MGSVLKVSFGHNTFFAVGATLACFDLAPLLVWMENESIKLKIKGNDITFLVLPGILFNGKSSTESVPDSSACNF